MSTNINSKQKMAIRLLLAGTRKTDVAAQIGVQKETVSRWFSDSDFRDALRRAQDAIMVETIAQLTAGNRDAVDTIKEIVTDDTQSASVRLRAAIAWLEQQRKSTETTEILERLERLEKLMEGDK